MALDEFDVGDGDGFIKCTAHDDHFHLEFKCDDLLIWGEVISTPAAPSDAAYEFWLDEVYWVAVEHAEGT